MHEIAAPTTSVTDLERMVIERQKMVLAVAESVTDEHFFSPLAGDRWSIAENVMHLLLSAQPIARLLAGPRDILLQFGQSNRASRSFDELVTEYKRVLKEDAVKAPPKFTPCREDIQDRLELLNQFSVVYQGVANGLDGWTVDELDLFCIPHPALGLLTVHEMVHFTILHSDHHVSLIHQRLPDCQQSTFCPR